MPRIYTKTGDDGTTGLLYGGRVSKDDLVTEAYGTTDEAVAVLGLARSLCEDEVDGAPTCSPCSGSCSWWAPTSPPTPRSAASCKEGISLVDEAMVQRLEQRIDDAGGPASAPRGVHRAGREPGERLDRHGAQHVRRAERAVVDLEHAQREVNPLVRRYLNRLSDLMFVMARWEAGESEPASRTDV